MSRTEAIQDAMARGARPTVGKALGAIAAAFLVVLALLSAQLFQQVNADQIVVIQSPISGELTWHTSAGIKWQGLGKVTTYQKRSMYDFHNKIRFNDGAHANMAGSIQYELPLDKQQMTAIHVRFGGQDAVQRQLVQTVVDKATYMTGPLMSSKESYAEKRNALIWYVEDQVANGVYRTKQRDERVTDPITGDEKTVTVVEIMEGKDGRPLRQEEATLSNFSIKPFNFAITSLDYDPQVEQQIAAQQQATMDVQTAMAEAKKAEQRALTAEKEGQANAARARWEQEVSKAKAVTLAQQEKEVAETSAKKQLEVARLDAQAAEQYRAAQLSRAEGDATYRRKVMEADGALSLKLEAWTRVNERYAEAIEKHNGAWVPAVVMGGDGHNGNGASAGGYGVAGGAVSDLVSLLTARTAKDLSLDVTARPRP